MKVGDIVHHRVFGVGVILGIGNDSFIIKFERLKTCRNILFGYADRLPARKG